jgi:hypothetical protein
MYLWGTFDKNLNKILWIKLYSRRDILARVVSLVVMDIQDAMAIVLKKITVLLNFVYLSSLFPKIIVS